MAYSEVGSVILDGSGNGTVRLSQVPMGRRRAYVRVGLFISTGEVSLGGTAELFSGDDTPNNYMDGTITPWRDTATFSPDAATVVAPEQLTVKFAGCDPSAEARVNAEYIEL